MLGESKCTLERIRVLRYPHMFEKIKRAKKKVIINAFSMAR